MKKIFLLMIVCVFSLNACNDVKEEISAPVIELSNNSESVKI